MNTLFVGLAALLVVALVGWALAELKAKAFVYQNNVEEQEELDAFVNAEGFKEKSIYDSQRKNSIKGYSGV